MTSLTPRAMDFTITDAPVCKEWHVVFRGGLIDPTEWIRDQEMKAQRYEGLGHELAEPGTKVKGPAL